MGVKKSGHTRKGEQGLAQFLIINFFGVKSKNRATNLLR